MLKSILLEAREQERNYKDLAGDIVIGIPDGITVSFALAAGLSAVTQHVSVILLSGLTAVAIGSLAMGLGAYFTATTESEHFNTDVKSKDRKERQFLSALDINEDVQDLAAQEIARENDRWSDLMKERHGAGKAGRSGITIAVAYVAGGLLPLIPFLMDKKDVLQAIRMSMLVTSLALIISGFIKCRIRRSNPWTGTLRILFFAALAAAGAYGVAMLINR